jgi:hypothetical protein
MTSANTPLASSLHMVPKKRRIVAALWQLQPPQFGDNPRQGTLSMKDKRKGFADQQQTFKGDNCGLQAYN